MSVEDLKAVVAANIIKLRAAAGLTQAQLGEKLNYSDKTISKWERAEALPDAGSLKEMAAIFGVTVDLLLTDDSLWRSPPPERAEYSKSAITLVSVTSIWTVAVLTFVIMWLCGIVYWQTFVYAVPVMLITLLALNASFHRRRWNEIIVAALVASVILTVYLALLPFNLWQLLIVIAPAEAVVFFSFRIRKRKKA